MATRKSARLKTSIEPITAKVHENKTDICIMVGKKEHIISFDSVSDSIDNLRDVLTEIGEIRLKKYRNERGY